MLCLHGGYGIPKGMKAAWRLQAAFNSVNFFSNLPQVAYITYYVKFLNFQYFQTFASICNQISVKYWQISILGGCMHVNTPCAQRRILAAAIIREWLLVLSAHLEVRLLFESGD